MSTWVCHNGELIPVEQVPYHQFSRCMLYGGGLLETLLATKDKMAYFEKHYSRLVRSLKTLYPKIPYQFSQNSFLEAFNNLISKQIQRQFLHLGSDIPHEGNVNKVPNQRSLFRVGLRVFVDNDETSFHYVMEVTPHHYPKGGVEIDEGNVVLDHKYRKHKLTAYSISFLTGTLNSRERVRDQFICGKHGKIIEAIKANVAVISQNTLYLVELGQNILPGVTQEVLAENYKRWFKCLELVDGFTFANIKAAEEMLYLNSLSMCLSIEKVGGIILKSHYSPLIKDFLLNWE